MNIKTNISQLIGNTPLMELRNYEKKVNSQAKIIAKLEFFNPAGSAKDRVADNMIKEAEQKGILKSGATIIEPTSGNTGIGLAAVGVSKGYKVILTMPDTMSKERINLIRAFGATVILTDGAKGMQGSVQKAEELNKEIENSIIAGQFYNPANPEAHYLTTGPEIWKDTDGKIDIFVAGFGTGGTVSGVGKYLKEKNPNIKIVAFEPASSPLVTKGFAGAHKIQGIGANFIPENLHKEYIDEFMAIENDDALKTGNDIAKSEGILVGISSGGAVAAARILGERKENYGKNIVVLLPDTGERYLSTEMFL